MNATGFADREVVASLIFHSCEQSVDTGGSDLSGSEKTLELSYKAQVNRWLFLQPDVQFVFDPLGDSYRRTVVLLGMRTVVIS